MPKEMDLIKFNSIKSYVKNILKMKISKTSTDDLRIRFNDILKSILRESKDSAKEDRRETIMPRDTDPAIQKYLGNKSFTWEDIFKEVKRFTAIELGSLAKEITKYVKEEKEKIQ